MGKQYKMRSKKNAYGGGAKFSQNYKPIYQFKFNSQVQWEIETHKWIRNLKITFDHIRVQMTNIGAHKFAIYGRCNSYTRIKMV